MNERDKAFLDIIKLLKYIDIVDEEQWYYMMVTYFTTDGDN